MSSETLLTIIEAIDMPRCRRKQSSPSESEMKKWGKQEEKLLLKLIFNFGEDISLLQSQFVDMTRKQIRRKVKELTRRYHKSFEQYESKVEKQRKKSFFDEQILEKPAVQAKKNDKLHFPEPPSHF